VVCGRPEADGHCRERCLISAHLDSRDDGLVGGAVGEGDHDLAAAVSRDIEGLQQLRVFAHRALEVQVGEHRRTVDGNIEFTIAGSREIGLGKGSSTV